MWQIIKKPWTLNLDLEEDTHLTPLKTPNNHQNWSAMLVCHRELPLLPVSHQEASVVAGFQPTSPVVTCFLQQHLCLPLYHREHIYHRYPQKAAVAAQTQQGAPMNSFLQRTHLCLPISHRDPAMCSGVPQVSHPFYFIPINGSPFQNGITCRQS